MAAIQDLAERVKADDKVYIDTDVGADDNTADGSEAKPFKSLAYAYIQHASTPNKTYLTRQSTTGPVSADGDPAERLVWKDPAKAAIKKQLERIIDR